MGTKSTHYRKLFTVEPRRYSMTLPSQIVRRHHHVAIRLIQCCCIKHQAAISVSLPRVINLCVKTLSGETRHHLYRLGSDWRHCMTPIALPVPATYRDPTGLENAAGHSALRATLRHCWVSPGISAQWQQLKSLPSLHRHCPISHPY